MSKAKRIKTKRVKGHANSPSKKPYLGASVIYMYGNPTAIGSPTVPMSAVVTSMGSMDGRIVNGRALTDPGVSGTTPAGKPIEIPAWIPMVGARYSTSGAKLTWHWRGEVNLSDINLLRGGVAPVEGVDAPEDGAEAPQEAPADVSAEEEAAKVVRLK
tara:strand:- start:2253 stop:2726 length:474 start_codon:yes stop_codon:yes gene_type:complete